MTIPDAPSMRPQFPGGIGSELLPPEMVATSCTKRRSFACIHALIDSVSLQHGPHHLLDPVTPAAAVFLRIVYETQPDDASLRCTNPQLD
jgi:hypothetical protein